MTEGITIFLLLYKNKLEFAQYLQKKKKMIKITPTPSFF